VLEGNRELLVGGAATAAMPNLVNLQMELRKACNHPWLIKGVEDNDLAADTPENADAPEGGEAAASQPFLETMLKVSGKMVLLNKLLPKLKAEGHRVLIFSQMVSTLTLTLTSSSRR
jgi:chromodomain-helicase-DNA-binding protein 7